MNRNLDAVPERIEITVSPTRDLDEHTRTEIIDLCNAAFNQEGFNVLFQVVEGSTDPMHVLARLDGRLVGHGVWSTRRVWLEDGTELKTAYLDAVATLPSGQRRGIGSAVVRRITDEIRGYDIGCLSTERISFYQHIGWELWTGERAVKTATGEIEPMTGDILMISRTVHTPPLDTNTRLTIEWRPEGP